MGAPALRGPPDVDVLAGADEGGGDDDGAGPRHRSALASAAGVTAVVSALLLGTTVVDGPPEPAPLLALRGAEPVPRDRTVGDRLAEAGLHVEVVNTSELTMVVRGASLVPGAWEVDLVDRALLRPGQSVLLSLHRTISCDERASYGPAPEHLVVDASTDGGTVAVRLAVDDPAAYGGRLDDVLRDPGRACVVTDGDVGGPIGDLVSRYRARRAAPPEDGR